MQHLLLFLSIFLLVMPLAAMAQNPAPGQCSMKIKGKTIPLPHVRAHFHDNAEGLLDTPKELRILFTDREVKAGALNGIVFLEVESMAKEGKVQGLLLKMDPANHNQLRITLLYPPSERGETLLIQTVSTSGKKAINLEMGKERVKGELSGVIELVHPDRASVDYALRFDTPLVNEPAVTADLKGKAAQDSPQVGAIKQKAEAMIKGDIPAYKRLCSARALSNLEIMLTQAGPQAVEFMKEAGPEMKESIKNIQRVVVRGERAAVIYNRNEWSNFILEGGEWKIAD